jgi:two-component system, OmpR family, sensor kinase
MAITSKLKLLGLLISLLLLLLTLFMVVVSIFYDKRTIAVKSMNLYKFEKSHSYEALSAYLITEGLILCGEDMSVKGEHVLRDPLMQEAFYGGEIILKIYENHYYIKINNRWYKERTEVPSRVRYIIGFILLLGALLLFLHRFVYHAILPLRSLDSKIRRYGMGDKAIDTRLSGDDEVAHLGNAFYETTQMIERLSEARELFLRNIMHEFKTPLTRATLMAHMIEDGFKHKETLLLQFGIMQHHLDAMHQCEQLSQNLLSLECKKHLFIDLIEDVIDQLGLEEMQVTLDITTPTLMVDYDFFVIVLKNLIDNGVKYSSDAKVAISYQKERIIISNYCKKPEIDFKTLLEPFKRGGSSVSGMGLGLYITKEILQKHRMRLVQKYIHGTFFVVIDGVK